MNFLCSLSKMSAYKPRSELFFNLEVSNDSVVDGQFNVPDFTTGNLTAESITTNTIAIGGSGSNASQLVFVNKSGNDTNGDGSFLNPFLTVQQALIAILDASPSKTYSIQLGAGTFSEAFSLKPYIGIVGMQPSGTNPGVTTIANTSIALDSSFAAVNSAISWCSFLSFANAMALTLPATGCNLQFLGCVFGSTAQYTGTNSAINTVVWGDTIGNRDLTVTNSSFDFFDSTITGTVRINSSQGNSAVGALGGAILGNLYCTSTGTSGAILGTLMGTAMSGILNLDGSNTHVLATATGIPDTFNLTNSAVLTPFTTGQAIHFKTALSGNWGGSGTPNTVSDAIDRLSTTVKALNGGTPIP
jgi:hypothetical protein